MPAVLFFRKAPPFVVTTLRYLTYHTTYRKLHMRATVRAFIEDGELQDANQEHND